MTVEAPELGFAATIARRAKGLLSDFNRAGILTAADVHVAQRLGVLGGESDDTVLLAVALAVRSTRLGSVVVDLATAAETTSPDDGRDGIAPAEPPQLPWPAPGPWAKRCAASPLTAADGPVRHWKSRLWLARYWDQESEVARELLDRCADRPDDLDAEVLAAGLQRLFPKPDDADQQLAAAVCALSRVSVLAGGPGTGKTTTVARLLALLREQHPDWRIALAAPTGKAAARLEEAVRSATAKVPDPDRDRLGSLHATTLHRLLGWRPDARSRFKHNRGNRLPFEVVVVDESSMLSLTLMARLLEALRPATHLVLVGDPDQLASVEAGAVLADLVDRTTLGQRTPEFQTLLRSVLPDAADSEALLPGVPDAPLRDGVVALSVNRRFAAAGGIAALAAAIQAGEGAAALALLRTGGPDVTFVEVDDDARLTAEQLADVRADVMTSSHNLYAAASAGDGRAALGALEQHRLLCAHRAGPRGVQHWSEAAATWSAEVHDVVARADGHYLGQPLLVTSNDYDIDLYNGDTGVVVDDGRAGLIAVFGRGGAPFTVPLARLGAVRPLHAMTIHRAQGSQFTTVSVLLPAAHSPLATRETLYTAVTRAMKHVRIIGSASALERAVSQPAARATGLRDRLSGRIS